MQEILIATLVVGVVGLLLGLALVTASKKFYVEVDDRVTKVRECLRGANCGACGYAGCDAVAEAIVKGEARVDACPGNSTENIAKIAAILGKETIHQDPQVAFIRCGGTCNATKAKGNYVGTPKTWLAVAAWMSWPLQKASCIALSSAMWLRTRNSICCSPRPQGRSRAWGRTFSGSLRPGLFAPGYSAGLALYC